MLIYQWMASQVMIFTCIFITIIYYVLQCIETMAGLFRHSWRKLMSCGWWKAVIHKHLSLVWMYVNTFYFLLQWSVLYGYLMTYNPYGLRWTIAWLTLTQHAENLQLKKNKIEKKMFFFYIKKKFWVLFYCFNTYDALDCGKAILFINLYFVILVFVFSSHSPSFGSVLINYAGFATMNRVFVVFFFQFI